MNAGYFIGAAAGLIVALLVMVALTGLITMGPLVSFLIGMVIGYGLVLVGSFVGVDLCDKRQV